MGQLLIPDGADELPALARRTTRGALALWPFFNVRTAISAVVDYKCRFQVWNDLANATPRPWQDIVLPAAQQAVGREAYDA